MMRNGVASALAVVGMVVLVSGAEGQWRQVDDRCEANRGDRDRDRHCLVLEATFADEQDLSVDGGTNGGVNVEGWDRDEIEVRAEVWADAGSVERAEALANEVEIRLVRGRLSADGPETGRRESWGVRWEVRVPRATDLDIETHNGGIAVVAVTGRIRFQALNGGVRLTGVGGDVAGRTTNGGLHVELAGDTWQGEGLDVQTTNGGVTVRVPDDYSARLETGTVNGGIDIDFPITVSGRIGKRLATTLGDGGPTIRAITTNGGVKIQRGERAVRFN